MNEVRFTPTANVIVAGSASSKGAAAATTVRGSGNNLPDLAVNPTGGGAPQAAPQARRNLQEAVAEVSNFVQSVQRDLQFTVDEDLGRTIIRVVDSDSGELIRQIPEDIFLELARRLNDDREFNLVNALG